MINIKNGKDVKGQNIEIFINNEIIEEVNINFREDINEIIKSKKNIRIIDLEGKTIMPGVIDIHTHMREPGITLKEDFETGSRACAKAGITTFYDMPNTIPTTTTLEALIEKKKLEKEKSIVTFGFHFGGSRNNNIDEIKKILENGKQN